MDFHFINPTEIAYAVEHACKGSRLGPIVVERRKDGRDTKPGEVRRMWAAWLRRRYGQA